MPCQIDSVFEQVVVDSLEFARHGRVVSGGVRVAVLERIKDMLAADSGVLACELRGLQGADGKYYLRLLVSGGLTLLCQRCLGPLVFSVTIDSTMLLVAPGESWPDEELANDGCDAIEAAGELSVLALVEDEVLLALPIVPRHEHCLPLVAAEAEQKPSPFMALTKLKNH